MKKFLSLALALVMTMSLVVVGAGAKEFTDDSKIAYSEAVDVISAAGIIDGYTDGSFNPAGTLTRGAAAKIICNMILGPTTADALSADAAPFSDVPANHVFAGYIAYCSQQGIINGYADGTFKPAGTLTGYQFMKMLLGALGYEGQYEGFTGANWSINVAKLALNLGLEDGNDEFVGTKAVTREEACLYAFNTLKADMVKYTNNTQITVGDVVINTASSASKVYNDAASSKQLDDAVIGDEYDYMQFAEKYFSKLDVVGGEKDSYGRPAVIWYWDGEEIGTYAENADEELLLEKTGVSLATALTGADYLNLKEEDVVITKVYVNGMPDDTDVALYAGDMIEVFENSADKFDTVVISRYEVAKIDAVEDELSNNDVKKGATYAIDLANLSDLFPTSVATTLYDDHDVKATLPGFDADTYVKKAVLALVNGDEVLTSNVAESVTGPISAYKTGAKAAITIDGTKYPVAGTIQAAVASLTFDYDDTDYTLYLDPNGYVIGLKGDTTVALEDVYYVTAVATETGKWGSVDYAQAVALTTGEVVEFKLADDEAEDADFDDPTAGYLYTFEEDDGEYTAKLYEGEGDNKYDRDDQVDVKLTKDDTKLSGIYFDDETSFLKIEGKGNDLSVKTATGTTSVEAADATVITIYTKSGKTLTAAYVVIAAAEIGASLEATDVVYFSDNAGSKNADGFEAEAYYMDGTGTVETITYDKAAGVKTDKVGGSFFKFSVNDDGIYTLKSDAELALKNAKYDDETGYVVGVTLTNLHKNALTAVNDYGFTAEDIDLSDNVVIIDERDDEIRDLDAYKSEITNATRLKAAIDKTGTTVKATVFYDEEEVIFVAVTAVD